MAEVFGAVASALALAELFAKSVSKVKKLWDEVQDVPDEVAWLLEQLGHYKLAACRVAVENLEALAVDLQSQINVAKKPKRNIAKLKVSLKKDAIQKHQQRLNFIFNMLSMSVNAQSLFQNTQLVNQNTQIIYSFIRGLLKAVRMDWHKCWKSQRRHTSRALRRWLEVVQDSGIDLEEYGKHESDCLYTNHVLRRVRWNIWEWDFERERPYDSRSGPRLERIVFGPKPEDWKFVWDPAIEEYVEEFWDMVETPPLQVPGAWVEDVVEW
ncbi:hypothetical protein CMUS01_02652 [Colletotrichum musicola]|uniref:Fungal N-terminal domain-containing protein n=1 Tax=Colletotrichum musicola TaxID=2175873 RepID=A0A8H6U7K9_9PEZI|nr:hypothetical protein CMUS01_02652 [Colletotrichum musicola]